MSINRVVLVGRLGKDPELKYTPSGTPVANFSVAVDRGSKDSEGNKETDWINCVAFKQQAEFAGNYLGKGRLVAIEGRWQVRNYTTSDGQKRTSNECVVDRLQGLDKPKQDAAEELDGADPFGDQ